MPVGEIGINAAFCGAFGCPVLLVTGDAASCREGTQLLGTGLTTVAVKEAFGRTSARHVAPQRARHMIERAARECLGNLAAVAPYEPGRPCEIRAEFIQTAAFDEYRRRPPSPRWATARWSAGRTTSGPPGASPISDGLGALDKGLHVRGSSRRAPVTWHGIPFRERTMGKAGWTGAPWLPRARYNWRNRLTRVEWYVLVERAGEAPGCGREG